MAKTHRTSFRSSPTRRRTLANLRAALAPPDMPPPPAPPPDDPPRAASWLRRLGMAGFLFFLIKGLLWLLVPALLVTLGVQC